MEDEDNFKCNLCNNAYKYQGTLKTHIMIKHCKTFSYNCTQCEYHGPSVDGEKHETIEDESKGIESDTDKAKAGAVIDVNTPKMEANKKFPLIIQKETQLGKYKCDECEKDFKKKSHLDEHILIHSGKKPFPCEKCGFSFRRADKMRKHTDSCNYVNRKYEISEQRSSSEEMGISMPADPEESREADDNLEKKTEEQTPKEQRRKWRGGAPPTYWVWDRYICEKCKRDFGYANSLGLHRKRSHGLSYRQEKLGYNGEIKRGSKIKQNPNEPGYGTSKQKGRQKKEGGQFITQTMPCFGCEACKSDDCMECKWCHDKKRQGGQGLLSKKCIKRRCTQPKISKTMMDHYMPSHPMNMVGMESGGDSRIHYTTTPFRTMYLQAGGLVKAMPCRFG